MMQTPLELCGVHGVSTLPELLRLRAQLHPERTAFIFLEDGEREETRQSFAELHRDAERLALRLAAGGAAGSRALLLYRSGPEFVTAFVACLYAGVTAVPLSLRYARTGPEVLERIAGIARPALVLTDAANREGLRERLAGPEALASLPLLASDDPTLADPAASLPAPDPGSPAFLQFTSGSTGHPRGVTVTHRNILSNEALVYRAFGHDESTVVVSWLPHFHDMGLIGGILQPLYGGYPCVLMSPEAFVQRPVRWLAAIARYRATTSGGPSFAYRLCAERITEEERRELDLSSWQVAFNGAEPVHAETLDTFARAFEGCGFRRSAFFPCYGLAEATLFVSGGPPGEGATVRALSRDSLRSGVAADAARDDPAALRVTACGTLWPEQRVEIVDPDRGERLPEGRVGEIWVAGESVAAGYWDDPEATERTFGGRLDGGPERFLRTGDAGFVRDGRLYVTGRLKDVVILNGQNYHAEDIEETVVATGRLGVRCQCAAFALLRDGEEELAVVAEVDRREAREPGEVVAAVRARLNEVVGVRARVVALVARGGIPRTTSGKIRRAECRRQYLEGELRLLHEDVLRATAAPDGAEGPLDRAVLLALPRWERAAVLAVDLRAAAARLLHVEPDAVDPEAPLGRLGLDSLGSIQLAYAVERHLEVRVPLDACLGGASLRELAERAAVLAEGTAEAPGAGPEGSAASGDERDLSHGQQALYLTHRLAPASTAYHVSKALRLLGPLDVAALERALQRVLERHESLRSTFTQRDGRVVRRVVEEPSALPLEDATGWTAERLQRRVEEEAEAPFDLHDGPPVRVRLFRREEEHVLLFVAHHILVDFWSLVVVVDELGRLYRAELDGTRPTLEPAASYAEYVAWQDGLLAAPRGEELWAYWRETLPREAEPLHLPTDFPRPPEQTYRGGEIRTRAGGPLTAGLRRAAAWQGCTLHTLLLTAYGVLLHRYSGQEEVRIGCPLFGRTREAFSRTVGYFVNPLPVRIRCEGIPHFAALARGVGEALGGAVAHQDLPFPLLVERLNPLRDPARTPLFQAMFVFPRAHLPGHGELSALAVEEPVARLRMGDVELESFPLARRAAQFEVKLTAAEAAGELHLALEYNADLWETESIQRLLVAYRVLLEGIASDAEAPVGTLPLLDAAVRDELLRMSRGPSRERAPTTLHGLFEAQVRATPDAPALLFGDAVLTFAGLDGRADRLARRLRERGVGPGARVAVHLRRSPEMVVAVLAALKAGAAYVPVDPASSAEVVRFILDDAAPAAVLTDAELAAGLPEDVPVFLVSPDGDGEPGDAEDLGVEVGPDDPAWVLYTSGSTGWPKGVVGCHRGSVNRCAWMWEAQPFRPGEVCFQNTGLGVVDSTWEIWAPLARGVPVRIVTDEVARDPGRLLRELGRHGITRICLVPSLLRVMLEEHPERIREAPRLVTWVASGEPLPADLVERFYRVVPHGVLYNQYGLTESSADITSFDTRALRGAPAPASVPVGRPISNVEAYILDRYGNPAPVGAAGELHLGGACLAREYLNLPERTARAFVATPLGEGAPILYRTGDLARYRADGTLEYLGRIDRQVKVRGFRVEPEGVELHLRRHPCVTQAVVSAFPHERDGNLLVAHVVCASGPPPPPAELRVFLGAVLPEHSIPSRFVFLDALPLTGSGKIDRKALPLPAAAPDAEGTQPRSEVEELVAGTFAALLGVPRPGIFDDFFDLGGHSLLAARAVSMLRDRLGVEIPLATFFRAPRPADLARVIEASRGTEEAVPPARIGRIPREGPLPLSPAQERLWFLDRMDPGMSTYNNFSAVRLEGELCREALRDALHALLERHEALRTTFLEHDGSPVTVVAPSPDLRLDFRDLSGLAAGEREGTALRQAGEEAARPFDLSEGPLFRALLLRLDERVHLLVVTVHHIVSDGWSVGVLTREVPEFYAASREGRPPALPRLPVQYPDYAAWQRAWLESGAVDAQMEYWRAALARSDAVLELPTDRPRPPVQSYRGAVERFVLPAGLRDRLRAVGQREGATLFMTLLAGLQCLLHRYTGQTGFVIGSPIAGRTRSELEGLIGLFANTLALRADLSGDPPFRELLGRVRESTLGAYQHQDLPFERLVEALRIERDLARTPLFQVMYVHQGA
ncbi:MAG TPA: amino acid adenylation domain-containing protein, partial [Longimicrobiaceae bacterium]|nr:amino acid adenylation domain-containing protein [Longimicrobiaceae bacterium]